MQTLFYISNNLIKSLCKLLVLTHQTKAPSVTTGVDFTLLTQLEFWILDASILFPQAKFKLHASAHYRGHWTRSSRFPRMQKSITCQPGW